MLQYELNIIFNYIKAYFYVYKIRGKYYNKITDICTNHLQLDENIKVLFPLSFNSVLHFRAV